MKNTKTKRYGNNFSQSPRSMFIFSFYCHVRGTSLQVLLLFSRIVIRNFYFRVKNQKLQKGNQVDFNKSDYNFLCVDVLQCERPKGSITVLALAELQRHDIDYESF